MRGRGTAARRGGWLEAAAHGEVANTVSPAWMAGPAESIARRQLGCSSRLTLFCGTLRPRPSSVLAVAVAVAVVALFSWRLLVQS